MNKNEITENLVFLFVRGSQAYGTNTPESDEDIGGVCLPSKRVLYGLERFEQDDQWSDADGNKVDKSIYNLTKAVDLLKENNPNMLDFLYAPERCIRTITPDWQRLLDIRDEFICSKAKWSYQGYAVAQLNRIKTHRSYLLNPVTKPNRVDFGLPDKSIFPETQLETIARLSSEYVNADDMDTFFTESSRLFDTYGSLIFKKYIPSEYYPFAISDFKMRQKEFLRTIASISQLFLKEEYMDMAQKELRFLSAHKNWDAFNRWKKGRNEKRALMESKVGFDTKHAMHLIRLLRMSIEILSNKGILVDRTNIDRDELMYIRNGHRSFDSILEESEQLNYTADELYKTSTLPEFPNIEKIDSVVVQILDKHISR